MKKYESPDFDIEQVDKKDVMTESVQADPVSLGEKDWGWKDAL